MQLLSAGRLSGRCLRDCACGVHCDIDHYAVPDYHDADSDYDDDKQHDDRGAEHDDDGWMRNMHHELHWYFVSWQRGVRWR